MGSAFRGPAALAWLMGLAAASLVLFRPPSPQAPRAAVGPAAFTRVVSGDPQAAPLPPPLPVPAPTPVPDVTPRVAAPRPPGTRVTGSHTAAPRAIQAWIQIPSIGANAPVVAVGLDRGGNMVTPRNARDVAWLDNGSFPGPGKNGVLAGHRNYSGQPGTFLRLEQARAGDVVRVGMEGRVYTFSIVWVRTYDPLSAPVEELIGDTGVDSVTLVTCGGPFNSRTRHYTKRVVARAELVEVA